MCLGELFTTENESTDMKQKILVLTAILFLGPLVSIGSATQGGPGPSSLVLELVPGSRVALEAGLCAGSDGGGPKLDQIMLDDVDTGGGNGKAHWIFELGETGGGSEYTLRPVQGCSDGGQVYTQCGVWNVKISLDVPSGPTGLMVLHPDPAGSGGMARGEVEIPLNIEFTEAGSGIVKQVEHDFVYYIRAPWATTRGPDAWESSAPFPIDTDCDGVPDEQAPPTTGAPALGWMEDATSSEPIRGLMCGAGEEVGGWLCGSPVVEPPDDAGDGGDLGDPGEGGMP